MLLYSPLDNIDIMEYALTLLVLGKCHALCECSQESENLESAKIIRTGLQIQTVEGHIRVVKPQSSSSDKGSSVAPACIAPRRSSD